MSSAAEPVVVVFSDAHLQTRPWKHRPIVGDAFHAFTQVIDYALEHALPLIGAGDLIDKRINDSAPIVFLKKQLDRLAEASLPLYYIQGQHEFSTTPWFELGTTATHLHQRTIELSGIKFHGLDFQSADRLKEALAAIPEHTDYLVGHQVWSEFMGEETLPQGSFASIPHVAGLLTGDLHKTVVDRKQYRGAEGQPLVVYSPGATYQTNISEPSDTSFGVLYSDGRIKLVPLVGRIFIDWAQIVTDDELEACLSQIGPICSKAKETDRALPDELRTPLIRVTLAKRLASQLSRIEKQVGAQGHLFYKRMREQEPEQQTKNVKSHTGKALTLLGCLPQVVDSKKKPQVFQLCQRLLEVSPDGIDLELEKWKQQVLETPSKPARGQ